ncbi:acyltransferase [Flavobacterium cucumis]|uniref:Peptidoglycan/LPS O-acetylase OafA/YrhL, contains acyltransferase and SGNH-hydrolase domains n=1 Tax=Flavobacterium cucumis TaxID=416016 RepID=A0A1M7ZUE8_9FLAO|nr:acyltransferase [Flavobacterium cucumis]SHO72521.1 Peptidoglycan/LPS O-acetylase OafA/YrhL, contains acyltransferase and SGNH-hydrolase domains [Flavobacterium cucumis]
MKYIRGINGLRAVAVIFVIISHWFPKTFFLNKLPLGNIGVDIFFVISGFLITSILLKENKDIEAKQNGFFQRLMIFFLKRTFRIFPIYYMLLFFLYLTNGNEFRDYLIYYLTYTSNYLFYYTQNWHGLAAHFWSLAVEEQFYLFWPVLLFLTSKRNHLFLIIFLFFSGIGFSYFVNDNMSRVLTINCFHALGTGALLACLEFYEIKWRIKLYEIIKFLFYPLIILTILNYTIIENLFYPSRLVVSVLTFRILIMCIDDCNSNFLFKFLNIKFLDYLGMISYGLYLYHNIVPTYVNRFIRKYNIEIFENEQSSIYFQITVYFVLLILISSLSWSFIEKPLLKLKKYIQ